MEMTEVTQMTNQQTKALLKAIEIIVELAPTKEEAQNRIKEIAKAIEKEPTSTNQSTK